MESFFSASQYAPGVYSFPLFLVGALIALLGFAALLREKSSPVSGAFFLLTACVALWLLCFGVTYASRQPALALNWVRLANSAVVFIPSFFYLFALSATGSFKRFKNWFYGAMLISLVFAMTLWGTPFFIAGVQKYFWGYYPRYGAATFPFLFFFFSLMAVCFRLFWNASRRSGRAKKRYRNFIVAFSIAYLASVDYFAAYGIPVYPFGYIPVLIFTLFMAWDIGHYRLVDITPSFAAGQILKTMADGLLVFDREGIVRVANEAATRLFGEGQDDLAGRRLDGEGLDFFKKENLARLLWTGTIQNHEMTYFSRLAGLHTLDVSTSVIRDSNKEPVAVVCIIKDTSSRKSAEQALRESESHYRILAENLQDVIWTMDMNLKLTYISPSVSRLRGYSPAEAMAQPLETTFSPASAKTALVAFSGIFQDPDAPLPGPLELEYLRNDGCGVWAEVQITVLKNADGRVKEILGVSRNISEHRKIRETLKTADACYWNLIAAVSDPIMVFEKSGALKSFNRSAELALGYAAGQLMGKTLQAMNILDPESAARTLQEMTLVWLGWQRACFEVCFVRRDGSRVIMEAVPSLIRKNTEQPFAQIIFRNVREMASGQNQENAA